MAILKDCEIWFAKLDPKRPNTKFDKENPTWEIQIRTTNKETKKQWEALSLPVKAVVPDEGPAYFRVNLKKKTIKSDGEKSSPVKVVNGALEDVDPGSIGNGSRGNVQIFQYEYTQAGKKGLASVLMKVQITKHVVFKRKPRDDDFEMTETEIIEAEESEDGESEDADF